MTDAMTFCEKMALIGVYVSIDIVSTTDVLATEGHM